MVRRAVPTFGVAAALSLTLGAHASAHAALTLAEPRVGSTVGASPAEVRMWFSEALEPAFSDAVIIPDSGHGEVGTKALVDPKDRRELVVLVVRPLPPGRYQVKWGVVSVDGHRTEGDFRFAVRAAR